MSDIQSFLCEVFEEEYCVKTAEERKEFLSWFLNEDKNCVLWEQLHSWIEDTLEIIIPSAPANFLRAICNSIDMEEMRDLLFSFVEHEEKSCDTCKKFKIFHADCADDDEEEGRVHGDERLDKWVHEHYGEECDWVLLDSLDDDQEVVERLPDFIVLDDDNNKLKGIAIINKNDEDDDEDDDEEENMPLVEGVDYEVLDD